MNSLYGENVSEDFNEEHTCKSELSTNSEKDENVLDYWKLLKGEYVVKLKQDDDLETDTDLENTMPAHLGSFKLNDSRRIKNNFIREVNGFKTNSVYYSDTVSLYIEKKHWDVGMY